VFEWVQHGDASARRRARAHVTRGLRRQKADAAQLAKAKTEASKSKIPSLEEERSGGDVVVTVSNPPRAASEAADEVLVAAQPYNEAGPKVTILDFALVRTIGLGKTDPFASLPLRLDATGHAVLEHCEPLPATIYHTY
jgi:hypothetical protein